MTSSILNADSSVLLVVDVQERLMPAIHQVGEVVANVDRLVKGARQLGVGVVFTEQNPKGLGITIDAISTDRSPVVTKMSFDAVREGKLFQHLPEGKTVVVAGCEAHVCVLQTVFGLIEAGRDVAVALDAVGSRRLISKETALARMARRGAEIVTVEMVLFEWLERADRPEFRSVVALVK